MEEALWKSADKLRGSVEPAEYKHCLLYTSFKAEREKRKLTQQEVADALGINRRM